MTVIIVVKSVFLFSALTEIPGSTPGANWLLIYDNIRTDQLVREMRNVKYSKQAICNDFVDRFMTRDTMEGVIIRKFIVGFTFRSSLLSFQKRTSCSG